MSFWRKVFGVPSDSTTFPGKAEESLTLEDSLKGLQTALQMLGVSVVDGVKQEIYPIRFSRLDDNDGFIMTHTELGLDHESSVPQTISVYDDEIRTVGYADLVFNGSKRAVYKLKASSLWSPLDEDAEYVSAMRASALIKFRENHPDLLEDWMIK